MSLDALDMIGLEASGLEADADAKQDELLNPPAPPPLVDPAEAWARIPQMLGGLLAIAMPEVAPAYSEANCAAWGASMAVLAEKYEWDAGETITKWAPEIGIVFASLPIVLPTIAAIKARRADADKNKPAAGAAFLGDTAEMPAPGGFIDPH